MVKQITGRPFTQVDSTYFYNVYTEDTMAFWIPPLKIKHWFFSDLGQEFTKKILSLFLNLV